MVIFGCRKSDNSTIQFDKIDQNEIYLDSSQRIVKVISIAENNKVNWTSNYFYDDSTTLISTFYSDSSYNIFRYKIGENGYAKSSVDSSFYHQQVWISNYTYTYDSNGYLNMWLKNGQPLYFDQINGDLMSKYTERYSYYDTLNKIDIFWSPYYNGIVGKINKHLMKGLYGYYGLGTYQNSIFTYKLDSKGFVIEKVESNVSGNSTFNSKEVFNYMTKYKYVLNYAP